MVCCKLKSKTEETAVYYFGGSVSDITGEIEFDKNVDGYAIIKAPEKYEVYSRDLERLFRKYYHDFKSGNFKEKIAFQS